MIRLLLFLVPLVVSACTTIQPQPQALPLTMDTPVSNNCSSPLDDYETFSLMDDKGRKRILDSVSSTWALTRDSCEQLRLALLLSQPDRPDKDQQKALRLVEELLSGEKLQDAQAHQLARLLRDQLQQLRSRQLKSQDLRRRLKVQHAISRQLTEQLNALQSQLQQLKNIEQNINEKEQSIIAPSTGNISHEPP